MFCGFRHFCTRRRSAYLDKKIKTTTDANWLKTLCLREHNSGFWAKAVLRRIEISTKFEELVSIYYLLTADKEKNTTDIIPAFKKKWAKVCPNKPFEVYFLSWKTAA